MKRYEESTSGYYAKLEAELEECRRKFMNLDAPVKELAAENQKLRDTLKAISDLGGDGALAVIARKALGVSDELL